jgi:hypothetical protein
LTIGGDPKNMKNNIWAMISVICVVVGITTWIANICAEKVFQLYDYPIVLFNTEFTHPAGIILGVTGLIKDPKSITSVIGILLNMVLSLFPFVMIFLFGV